MPHSAECTTNMEHFISHNSGAGARADLHIDLKLLVHVAVRPSVHQALYLTISDPRYRVDRRPGTVFALDRGLK